jgi:hypothetical protein
LRIVCTVALLLAGAASSHAQLTKQQKLADFQTMADQYVKRYVALQWKQMLYGVDAFNIQPFLDRAAATTNDLDYYEVCIDYISQFHDGGHVFFEVPSDFVADSGLRVDTYDGGKPLIYSINRNYLPSSKYPFQVGDELVSIDGQPAADLMKTYAKYGIRSNPRTEQAFAASYLTYRPQSVLPHAVDTPDSSDFFVRRQNGDLEGYTIKWVKTGVPLLANGPVSSPFGMPGRKAGVRVAAPHDDDPSLAIVHYSAIDPTRAVGSIGALRPVFTLPSDFKQRLGANSATDAFYSGSYQSGGHTIGFIRIPSFSPSLGIAKALAQFEGEMAWFNANTDGLIVDDMRNPGGTIYYAEDIARRLIPVPFHLVGFELRATTEWVMDYSYYVQYATATGMPDYDVAYLQSLLQDVQGAYAQNGGHTGAEPLDTIALSPAPPVPSLDTTPATDKNGNIIGYTKPMIVLTDEFSMSCGDMFPAMMQDNHAALIYGMRTSGLGGTNASYDAGAFSESYIGMLRGFMVRNQPVVVDGYPTSNYIENVGVQPDIVDDYKTSDNLVHGGATFVGNFTSALVKLIEAGR